MDRGRRAVLPKVLREVRPLTNVLLVFLQFLIPTTFFKASGYWLTRTDSETARTIGKICDALTIFIAILGLIVAVLLTPTSYQTSG